MAGYNPWGRNESDMTVQLPFHFTSLSLWRAWVQALVGELIPQAVQYCEKTPKTQKTRHIYTVLYRKLITNKDLLDSTGSSSLILRGREVSDTLSFSKNLPCSTTKRSYVPQLRPGTAKSINKLLFRH